MRNFEHVTSAPPRPVANVSVEMNGKAGTIHTGWGMDLARVPESVQNVRNMHKVSAGVLDTIKVVLTGTQTELEALFVERYDRKLRMEAARRKRQLNAA